MRKTILGAALCLICVACNPSPSTPDLEEEVEQSMPIEVAADQDLQRTLPELSDMLSTGELTSVALVAGYLDRIERLDRSGPTLRAVLTINPDAMAQAEASDARRKADRSLGPLDGVPVLIKDNIETLDPMPTTAGSTALKDNVTGRDSPLAAGLRAQGAVILGKTNLSQWANIRSSNSSSGWSSLGGQVRNPHVLDRNPCGSSSGSGAAIAASLAAGAVGTETNGSIICPSNVNGIVGFKPTVGVISQDLIVPISFSQDTAGPMTKTVRGAALMMNAMAAGEAKQDYVAALDEDSLAGKRIGVARFSQSENADLIARFDAALAVLEAEGAELVEIESFDINDAVFWPNSLGVLLYELKATLNDYLASTLDVVETRTLADLIAFNQAEADVELALFDQDLFEQAEALGSLDDAAYTAALSMVQAATRENGIDLLLAENDVVALVSPSGPISPQHDPAQGDQWPDWAGIGHLAAIAGYPHVTVPNGTVNHVPLGFSIIGAKGQDAEILSLGYAFEQAGGVRVEPAFRETVSSSD